MKNLKKMTAAAGLTAVLIFGAVPANAGTSNNGGTAAAANAAKGQCTVQSKGILQYLTGIIISGLTGIPIFDAPAPACAETDGQPTINRVRWS